MQRYSDACVEWGNYLSQALEHLVSWYRLSLHPFQRCEAQLVCFSIYPGS